jgi:hypothetical protein
VSARSLVSYGIDSILAPRANARRLMAEDDVVSMSWKLVLFSAVGVFLSALVTSFVALTFAPDLMASQEPLFLNGYAGYTYEALLTAVISIALTLLSAAIWKFVFGYRMPVFGALAAAALVAVLYVPLSPLIDTAFILTSHLSDGVQIAVALLALVPLFVIPAFYYSEVFTISFRRAFFLNVLATLMIFTPIFFLPLIAMFYYLSVDITLPGVAL